ncbi:hypothetical protein C4K40_4909 [Pseudomonas sp. CMR5c]|nr:hypothetical protein C4K40_4909 [Pseudomonas sp. CMR5c]
MSSGWSYQHCSIQASSTLNTLTASTVKTITGCKAGYGADWAAMPMPKT